MPTLGVSMIAHNEERQVAAALASVAWVDQVVVVDCESTDRTAEIVRGFPNARLFQRLNNPNLNVNKSFGIAQLSTDWIFYLDPDEIIPAALAEEMRNSVESMKYVAFKLPRRNHFFGRWLRFGGQFPDLQLRLFRRGKGVFPNKHVHESLSIDGTTGVLTEPFDHFPYPTINDYIRKMNFYTSFQADFWAKEGKKTGFFDSIRFLFVRPGNRFLRRYFFKDGFRDGWQGYLAALGDAFQIALSFGKLLERKQSPQ